MPGRAAISGLVLALLAGSAQAGQTSAGFTAGIVIGGGGKAGRQMKQAATTTYTWGAAAISVKLAGFGNLQRIEKSDTLYWFTAKKGGGNSYRVAVSISSGVIVKVIPA